jgi:integral membrane sensor domain MASE1
VEPVNKPVSTESFSLNRSGMQIMNRIRLLHKKHQFRLALCGHKAVETGAACLMFMIQGQVGEATLSHFLIASQTGVLTVFPLLGITLTRHARYFANRWVSALFVAVCAFLADALVHGSHYPGTYTEAALTALGAFALSIAVSYTPVGKQMDRLAESFLHVDPVRVGGS